MIKKKETEEEEKKGRRKNEKDVLLLKPPFKRTFATSTPLVTSTFVGRGHKVRPPTSRRDPPPPKLVTFESVFVPQLS